MANPTLESRRHAQQLDFVASGSPLVVGSLADFPLDLASLKDLQESDLRVEAVVDSGLTARVYCLNTGGRQWALKRARPQARVRNVDGQTSFLNEVQRRADLQRLKGERGGQERWAGVVDTVFASFRDGVMVSPWIHGSHVDDWDERKLSQVLGLACELWVEGLFEWDLCSGNLLDDGRQVRLFDFGYMYRFDPLHQFSSAGHGTDIPLFHPVERFESRCFCATLLDMEKARGHDAALGIYRLEKEIAVACYQGMRSRIAQRGCSAEVDAWLDGITRRWEQALQGDLASLYLAENWRSHVLDLDDDLRGETCTPMTLRRAEWLLAALDGHEAELRAQRAFFWGDESRDARTLRERYEAQRRLALRFQIDATGA